MTLVMACSDATILAASTAVTAALAAAEVHNPHPLAQALVKTATAADFRSLPETVSETFLGRGVRATVGHDSVVVGGESSLYGGGRY